MRRVRLSAAVSLDGYIAGPNGEIDWIEMDPDLDFAELMGGFDAVIMGRASYDAARAQHGAAGMPGLTTYVISTSLRQEDCPGVLVMRDPAAAVAELRARPGRDIWLYGGGVLFRSMLEQGLVDGMDIAIAPVLLGHGIPLLPSPAPRADLTLVKQRHYPRTGTLLMEYVVGRIPG